MKKIGVIQGKHPRLRVRMGVHPTRVEKDRTKYTRKAKHRLVEQERSGKPRDFPSARLRDRGFRAFA